MPALALRRRFARRNLISEILQSAIGEVIQRRAIVGFEPGPGPWESGGEPADGGDSRYYGIAHELAAVERLMTSAKDAWRGWGALLGCQCPDCQGLMRQFVGLWLDSHLTVVGSCAVAEDHLQAGPCDSIRSTLRESVGDAAFAAIEPHLQDALAGRAWSGSFEYDAGAGAVALIRISCLPVFARCGALSGVQIAVEDKTRAYARKAAHAELRDRLSIIQQHAADGIVSINDRGTIESVNAAAERMFGWRAAELVGRAVSVLMPEADSVFHQDYVDRYLGTGVSGILNVGPREVAARRKDGSILQIEISVAEANVGDHTVFIGVCRERPPRADAARAG